MYNGGFIGKIVKPDAYAGKGMWRVKAVAAWIERARWSFGISATVNATSFFEGDTITVTVTTTGLPDNTTLYWTINSISGAQISTNDFSNNIIDGTLNIVNNTDFTSRKLRSDKVGDGTRTMALVIRSESIEGPIVASTPVLTLKDIASGGQAVVDRGGFRYHKFTSTSTFQVNKAITAACFLCAGGGGGGGNGGGGGGGGGITNNLAKPIPAGTYTVTIGAGGSAGSSTVNGGDGGMTKIFNQATPTVNLLSATGGGGGGSRDGGSAGRAGGCGGGGGGGTGRTTAGTGITGQGYKGGNGIVAGAGEVQSTGGGGGGTKVVGTAGAAKVAGAGGAGYPFDATSDGVIEYYAGGGGGGRTFYGTTGANGSGQGVNRGGGGKGGSGGTTSFPSIAGDTGFVVIKYAIPV